MNVYKLEKLRAIYNEAMFKYRLITHDQACGVDVPSRYYDNIQQNFIKAEKEYFAALDEMSQKEEEK